MIPYRIIMKIDANGKVIFQKVTDCKDEFAEARAVLNKIMAKKNVQ